MSSSFAQYLFSFFIFLYSIDLWQSLSLYLLIRELIMALGFVISFSSGDNICQFSGSVDDFSFLTSKSDFSSFLGLVLIFLNSYPQFFQLCHACKLVFLNLCQSICRSLCMSLFILEFGFVNLSRGDTGKCTHFPYLMFSIININSDHIIEKVNLILVLCFIQVLISNFH